MKKQRFSNKRFGFSLMELSIVLLVTSTLIFGISRSSGVSYEARVAAAQALTKSSPVNSIPDIVAWYETSLRTSFSPTVNFNGASVANWLDNSTAGNDVSSVSAPTYIEDAINGLPVVRFATNPSTTSPTANTAIYMTFDATKLQSSDYTIFVVEERIVTMATANYFLGLGGTSGSNSFGYNATGKAAIATNPSITSIAVPALAATLPKIIPRILTFYSNSANSTNYVFVGGTPGANSGSATKITLNSTTGYIGAGSSTAGWYSGDIAEIIIYNRALTIDERNNIQYYLSKKYSIPTNISSV